MTKANTRETAPELATPRAALRNRRGRDSFLTPLSPRLATCQHCNIAEAARDDNESTH